MGRKLHRSELRKERTIQCLLKNNLLATDPALMVDRINNLKPGGIAQLVERQLCKLDVRGSNPLASILSKASHPIGPVAQLVRACA